MNLTKSAKLYEQAQAVIPGGVNSPVRAFKSVGGKPLFIDRADGPYLYDADGNRYIDYVLSYGPLILGHAHPEVVEALQSAATRGTSYGAPTALETELAALVCDMVPSAEQIRFVNSGTEATMSVLRLARAYTKRDKIIKLQGNYHGHADFLLVQAGSGVATLGLPDSPGVPKAATQDTLTAPYNNLDALETLFNEYGNQIAALIMEPVCGNIGCVPPLDGYLSGVRALCDKHNALLIFDEVMTGFRVSLGGAQAYYNVTPDLTALGKVIGGGLPVGAYAGRRDIMQTIAPVGPMYQAGTLSGNPLAMTAGIATLNVLKRPGVFEGIVERTTRMAEGVGAAAEAAGISITQTQVGTMFSVFFNAGPITDYESVAQSDTDRFTRFFWAMIDNGVYLAPSQFEAGFFSMAHTDDTVAATIEAAQKAFAAIA